MSPAALRFAAKTKLLIRLTAKRQFPLSYASPEKFSLHPNPRFFHSLFEYKMSVPRLTFLYPHLFNPARVHKTQLALKPLRASQQPFQKAGISTTRPHKQETYAQRYGTAAEPQPPLSMPSKPQEEGSLAGAIEREVKSDTKPEQRKLEAPPPKEPEKKKAASDPKDNDEPDSSRDAAITATMRDPSTRATELDASESHPKQSSPDSISDNKARTAKPLETVLQMGAPEAEKQEEHKAPHLHAPPYVHHFDTFTLVRDLERGGFSEEQSVTIMKAVRGQLAVNLDVAKEGLVSKSDVDNVLFPLSRPDYSLPHISTHPAQKVMSSLTLFMNQGELPLPRRLLRTPHRNPQRPQILLHPHPHPALPPPTHLRHPLPARLPRNVEPQRRSPRHAQRPPHGRPHAISNPRWRD